MAAGLNGCRQCICIVIFLLTWSCNLLDTHILECTLCTPSYRVRLNMCPEQSNKRNYALLLCRGFHGLICLLKGLTLPSPGSMRGKKEG